MDLENLMPTNSIRILLAAALCAAAVSVGFAGPPQFDRVLPETTRASFCIMDVKRLEEGWRQTQLSLLTEDPAMEPFLRLAGERFSESLGDLRDVADISINDLRDVAAGEVRLAAVEASDGNPQLAALVDITGQTKKVAALVAKIDEGLTTRDATHSTESIGDATLHIYTWATDAGRIRQSAYFIQADVLAVTSNPGVARSLLERLGGDAESSLAATTAYRDVKDRCLSAAGAAAAASQIQWFLAPLALQRSVTGDDLEFAKRHGLDGVKAVGGILQVGVEPFDAVARVAVYAPPPRRGALLLIDLVKDKSLAPPPWLIADIDSYAAANLKFDHLLDHIGPLFDELAADGIEGTFNDILDDLKSEEGPGIDVRNELMPLLGPRLTIVSDHLEEAASDSGETLIAIATTDEEGAADAVKRLMRDDPQVTRVELPGYDYSLWQVADDPTATLPNMGMMVANGHLLAASHADLIRKVLLAPPDAPKLADAEDYKRAVQQRDALAGAGASVWMFSRTRREYRSTYQLVRAGKLDELDSVYGDLLRHLFGHDEDRIEGMPQLDFTKLPAFSVVEPHLSPVGVFVGNQPTGWMIVGFVGARGAE
jgi:hypothetical protein